MPSNRPKTEYLNLPLFSEQDTQSTFSEYWQSINLDADGVQHESSAFQLIDAECETAHNERVTLGNNIQTINQSIAQIESRLNALPDEIYNRVAQLLNDTMGGSY